MRRSVTLVVGIASLVAVVVAIRTLTPPGPAAAPVLTVTSDRWYVTAALPKTSTFVFVVRTAGIGDSLYSDVTNPFLIDPWKYGGRSVTVSARAAGSNANLWAADVHVDVAPPLPALTTQPGGWQVNASLPKTTRFVFVVKSNGLRDAYYPDVTPPFTVDRWKYGGRSVTVSARAAGPATNPWAPAKPIDVPPPKAFGIVGANEVGTQAKALGITLDRVEFTYGESIASMDAKVARDAKSGLTPLPLLSQYGTISTFDVAGWQRWASQVVARYGPDGTFWKGRSDREFAPTFFELLNEPYGFWYYPRPEPAAYASFFSQIVSAAKDANPRARFLLATYPKTYRDAAGDYTRDSWNAYLKASEHGPEAERLADAVSIHPYAASTGDRGGWSYVVATHNDFAHLPVWITELGYRIGDVVDGTTITEPIQAEWMQRSLVEYMAWPWAHALLWFTWTDYSPDNMWGLVRPDNTHRPSFDVYKAFIAANTRP